MVLPIPLLWQRTSRQSTNLTKLLDKYEIDDLYIFPEFQNRGIGTAVLNKCIDEHDGPVILYVLVKNHRAVTLYERVGFRVMELMNSAYLMMRD